VEVLGHLVLVLLLVLIQLLQDLYLALLLVLAVVLAEMVLMVLVALQVVVEVLGVEVAEIMLLIPFTTVDLVHPVKVIQVDMDFIRLGLTQLAEVAEVLLL
jgi:hypothetical protein